MKKIVCPTCGKVNFEAFVTYPHCAECGTLLPDAKESAPRSFWKRPIGASWWIGLLGLAAVALAFSVALLRTSTPLSGQLLVYGSLQRHLRVDAQTVMRLKLDTVASGSRLRKATLQQVEIRIPSAFLEDWTLLSIEPEPKEIFTRGNGTYINLGDMKVGSTLFLTWRANKAGEYRFSVNVFAEGYNPAGYMTTIQVDGSH